MNRKNVTYQTEFSKMLYFDELSREQNAQECDATDDDSSNAAGKQKKIICYFKLLFLPVLFLIAVSSPAQRILTLDEAIANALQKNYDIILSRNDSAIAAIDYSYRGAAFLPRINANAGTLWNNNSQRQTLSDGTKRNKSGLRSNNINSQLALSWTLF